jgi:hypothetical protein
MRKPLLNESHGGLHGTGWHAEVLHTDTYASGNLQQNKLKQIFRL